MSNHGYNTPEGGAPDWHLPLNANFERLDVDVEIRDAADALDEYAPKRGAKFLATDTGSVFLGEGSRWQEIGALAPPGGGATVERLLAAGRVVAVADGVPPGRGAVDPADTSTPVQDALDACGAAGGGTVHLPPTAIEEDGPVVFHDNCALRGRYGSSEIRIATAGVDGFVFDANRSDHSAGEYVTAAAVDGVTLVGPGLGADSGNAIRDFGLWRSRVGQLKLAEWSGVVWKVERDAKSFENTFEYVEMHTVDAGDAAALVHWDSTGAPNTFRTLAVYPTADRSGRNSRVVRAHGLHARIDVLNLGGAVGQVVDGLVNGLAIGVCNWEPSAQVDVVDSLFAVPDDSGFSIEQLKVWGRANYAYDLYRCGRMDLCQPEVPGELLKNVVNCRGELNGPVTYQGSRDEIDGVERDGAGFITALRDR